MAAFANLPHGAQTKTYIVTHTQKDPAQSYGLVAEGLRLVSSEYTKIDKNIWLVRSAATADGVANAVIPGIGRRDEIRVMEVGAEMVHYQASRVWNMARLDADELLALRH
ncbi:MAG: hypothetical protein KDJ45_03790 [Hyphomicrobiaceae bacterium]|mgnify:CR=1 FL=1|nr:hypothetical protein [Hyphomicrobiaceae bacterium]MCC0009322.1 hypothetical protein [Hyphomicrobiaceae bacterium]